MTDQTHPELHETPIGIRATGMRRETDSMGEIEVPADRYWRSATIRPPQSRTRPMTRT